MDKSHGLVVATVVSLDRSKNIEISQKKGMSIPFLKINIIFLLFVDPSIFVGFLHFFHNNYTCVIELNYESKQLKLYYTNNEIKEMRSTSARAHTVLMISSRHYTVQTSITIIPKKNQTQEDQGAQQGPHKGKMSIQPPIQEIHHQRNIQQRYILKTRSVSQIKVFKTYYWSYTGVSPLNITKKRLFKTDHFS